MDEMLIQGEELKKLAAKKPSAKNFRTVAAALECKWEGNHSLAMQTMAAWGDRRAIPILRGYLQNAFQHEARMGIRGVAVNALAMLITEDDAAWIEEFHRRFDGPLTEYELRPLKTRLSQISRGDA